MRILVIEGPTRTGKTQLAIALAKKFSGELISADSRQVYMGMDIGTGKKPGRDEKEEIVSGKGKWVIDGIPIYLYDVVKPDERFSVYQYLQIARSVLEMIRRKNKLPILVGGTGFYIKGLLDGIETLMIPPDQKLRSRLEKLPVHTLYQKLVVYDPKKAKGLNPSDRQNPRRLIRALEVASSKKQREGVTHHPPRINSLIVGLTASRETLNKRADLWVEKIVEEGLISEVKTLLSHGYRNTPAIGSIIYRPTVDYLSGQLTEQELKEKLKNQMHSYIRRQITFFKKDKRILWFNIEEKNVKGKVANIVAKWLNE